MGDGRVTWMSGGLAATAVLAGCNAIFGVDGLSYDAPSTTASSSSSAGGLGGAGGGGGSGAGGDPGGGGEGGAPAGGAGGGGESLVPVVRYYLDDADGGAVAAPVADSGLAPPLDLAPSGPEGEMTWHQEGGNQGVRWHIAGGDAGLRAPVDAKILDALDGAVALTVETVFEIEAAAPNGSRIFHVSEPVQFDGRLNLRMFPNGTMDVNFMDPVGTFPYPVGTRTVMHVVIDATDPVLEDRARVYVGGGRVMPQGAIGVANGVTLEMPATAVFNLGNRDCCRALQGTISYFALYAEPLDEADIVDRATSLAVEDDGV